MDRWSTPRRAATLLLPLLLLAVVWTPFSAHARAAMLLGDAVLRLPVNPLAWTTRTPATEEVTWAGGGRGVLVRPAGAQPRAALIVVLGAEPAAPDDPRVRRLTDSLARTGFAVLLPVAEPLVDGRVTPDEVPLLVGAYTMLRDDPRVRSDRIAFVGLSVGASTSLVAAADPAIAADVWLVVAIGAYHDAGLLAAEVLSGQYRTANEGVAWEPDETSVRVVRRTLEAARAAGEDGAPGVGRLLAEPPLPLDEAGAGIEALPGPQRAFIDAISPSAHLDSLRAPLHVLHDRGDPFIPWPHSAAIVEEYPVETFHLLDIFAHVDPDPGGLGVLLRDGWRLLRLFAGVIAEAR